MTGLKGLLRDSQLFNGAISSLIMGFSSQPIGDKITELKGYMLESQLFKGRHHHCSSGLTQSQ